MSDWKTEWRLIADRVSHFIRTDNFPDRIRPDFLRDAVRAYPCAGGKRLRPVLLMWSCGLFGGDPDQALPAAAAVEIYHNWTLVHDDIIDRDDLRRGKPTTHASLRELAGARYGTKPEDSAKFGADFAILAGDLQQAWAMDALLRLKNKGVYDSVVLFLAERMQRDLARDLISGEAVDVEFGTRGGLNVSEEEVREMIAGKTGAILRYCVRTGAVIAKRTPSFEGADLDLITGFADALGLAFQLQDDFLGIFGDEKKFGKPIGSDFQEAKPTLLFLAALQKADPVKKSRLLALTGLPEYSPESIAEIRDILTATGAADQLREEIVRCSDRAERLLDKLPDNPYRSYLHELTAELINRDV